MRPSIDAITDEAVAKMVAAGPPADLLDRVAVPVSVGVIGELVGVALDEVDQFRSLADAVSAADPLMLGADEAEIVAAVNAWQALTAYAAQLVATKRDHLGSDLLSDLIALHDDEDGSLTDEELAALVATLVAAGYRTTTSAIALGTIRLVSEGALAPIADDAPRRADAVEEILRIHAGQVGEPFPRFAHEDLDLDGASIAAGDMVLVRLEAAHRDPERFADPGRFQPGRAVGHIAFGRGPHHCIGAALARAELDAVLGALARQVPGLRLHIEPNDIEWVRGIDAAPAALPVTW